jgi:spoIIIJ-associated protein
MQESANFAKQYLEDLLSFFGANFEVEAKDSDGEVIELLVPSSQLNGFLIGQRGDTMQALQFLVSSALKNKEFEVSRVNIDIAGYKQQRADRLSEKALEWIKTVQESGEDMHLRPMNAADRRTIHKLAGEHDIKTESEGFGKDRHIVLKAN